MNNVDEIKIDEALEKQKAAAAPNFQEVLRRPSMSLGIYYLPAGSDDPQQPHSEDELYYILDGVAAIEINGTSRSATPGDAFYVAARVPHRFHTVERDLSILVFFAPAEGTHQ